MIKDRNKKIKKFLKRAFVFCVLFFVVYLVAIKFSWAGTNTVDDGNPLTTGTATGDYVSNKLINFLSWIVYYITSWLSKMLVYLIGWMVMIASWDKFINVGTVITGWVILRDLCNMFFVLILLVIAFATILRVESYNAKKLLPKLIIMAILINFSRTICGLIIDFSQIIMLSFVNALGDQAGGRIVDLLGIRKMWEFFTGGGGKDIKNDGALGLNVLFAILTAFFATLVAGVVIVAATVVFLVRVVYLWIYIILSPIAFLTAAFPQGQKYASRWWTEFMEQVIAGPTLAFFIWLALTTADASARALTGLTKDSDASIGNGLADSLPSNFTSVDTFSIYLITIGLLVGGLMETQKISGAIGSVAGKGMGVINKGKGVVTGAAVGAAKWGGKKTWGGVKNTGKAGYGALKATDAAFGGKGAKMVHGVAGKGKTIGTGLVAGMAVGGVPGALVGAGLVAGGNIIKRISNRWDDHKTRDQERMKISENDDGKFYNDGSNDFKEHDDGKFYRYDKDKKEWIGGGPGSESTVAKIKGKALKDIGTKSKTWKESFDMTMGVGKSTKDIAEKEKIETLSKDYEDKDIETLRRLMVVEGDDDRKRAMGLVAGKKMSANNAGDRKMVNEIKELVSSNSQLSDTFMESMKSNASLYFSNEKGEISEGALIKAIDQGKVKLDDQKMSGLSFKAMDVFAKALGSKFEKALDGAVKNDVDKGKLNKLFNDNVGGIGFEDDRHLGMRAAYSKITGKVDNGFKDSSGNVNPEELSKFLKKLKIDDYGKINKKSLEDSSVRIAIRNSLTDRDLEKIRKSKNISRERIEVIERIVSEKGGSMSENIARG